MTMLGKRLFSAVCGLGLLACTFQAHAFDRNRPGFLLGIGVGGFGADISSSGPSVLGEEADGGLAVALRIGAGINNNFSIYFLRDFQADSDFGFGLTGVGSTVYFSGAGPTPYVIGGLGLGDVSDDSIFTDSALGFAAMLGAGFAFTQGFHLDASVMYVDAELEENFQPDVDFEIVSYRLMARYTWF